MKDMKNNKSIIYIIIIVICLLLDVCFIHYLVTSERDDSKYLSGHEIEALNNRFEAYKGIQTGAQVISLIGRLIENSNTYADTPERVPSVIYENGTTIEYDNKNLEEYQNNLQKIKESVILKSRYIVSFGYSSSEGMLNKIFIVLDE